STLSFSQITKELGTFTKVTSFDKIDVTLIESSFNKIIINGHDSKTVEIINKKEELKIRMPITKILQGDEISVIIYYKNLTSVEANEGSSISSKTIIKATIFDVIAKEGAKINININVEKLNIKATSGAIISIQGKAKNQDVLINSGAVLNASNLTTNQTTITVNSGGNAQVYATDLVDAKVRAGGNIIIFGKPNQINQKIIAGGNIKESK
uniref:head GIN domain-containing protein n=1 Tax=uncultured Flavobacterium sp. TaxID=165435 RepID=UPI0030CA3ED2